MWQEVLRIINTATVEGLAQSSAPTHSQMFLQNLRHSNEVFAAFKVHTMGREMAANLFDADGRLKPFSQWKRDVSGIASHQVGAWLRTEYDTAVLRAHAAADWQEFERNRDIFPNLRWMPTTSPEPESSHAVYWKAKLTLPIDDPFWIDHHPGDRWNCKCSLEATDEPVVRAAGLEPTQPQHGLENNPGKDGHTFSDKHPYFPSDCSHCFAYKKGGLTNRLKALFLNREKDCYNCPFVNRCIPHTEFTDDPKYGKRLQVSEKADAKDLNDNISCAHTLLENFKDMEIHIRPHRFGKGLKNPEYNINGEIADRKAIKGPNGITSGFRKGIAQGCSIIVVDLDTSYKPQNLCATDLAGKLVGRHKDFENSIITKCYLTYKGKAVCIYPDDIRLGKVHLTEIIQKMQE